MSLTWQKSSLLDLLHPDTWNMSTFKATNKDTWIKYTPQKKLRCWFEVWPALFCLRLFNQSDLFHVLAGFYLAVLSHVIARRLPGLAGDLQHLVSVKLTVLNVSRAPDKRRSSSPSSGGETLRFQPVDVPQEIIKPSPMGRAEGDQILELRVLFQSLQPNKSIQAHIPARIYLFTIAWISSKKTKNKKTFFEM